MSHEADQEIQQKYMELQMLTAQLKQAQQQIEMFTQQIAEMGKVKESLEEISASKAGTDILSPLGAGIFVKAKLESAEEVVMNVGGEIAVNKSFKEAIEMVDSQVAEMGHIIEEIKAGFQDGASRVQGMQAELQKLITQNQKSK